MDWNLDFDWSESPKRLRNVYKQNDFTPSFTRLIAENVILVLSPQQASEPYNLAYDEKLVHKKLLQPLERFILASEAEDVEQALSNLKSLKQPSKMCRRVLKTGDVLFACNDCGYDDTCVVCIDCFHKSAHRDHNYRMANTDGGGCCDCGDIEAWKQHYACSDHMVENQVGMNLSDFEDIDARERQITEDKRAILDKIGLLPNKSIAVNYFLVCQAALHYAREMLAWTETHALPPFINDVKPTSDTTRDLVNPDPSSKNFFTVLFNDEVHTYDHVINTLVKIVKCSKLTASVMASTVSREGRSFIYRGDYKACIKIKNAIADTRDGGQGPLKVEVIHGKVLAHQAFALIIINWVKEMSLVCDAFRVLTAYTLLGGYDPIQGQEEPSGDVTLLEKIMTSNTSYWKMCRMNWNDLFVTSLLSEYSIKVQLAKLLTKNYPHLLRDFIKDDHEYSVSILTMTTQIYTVPSLICMLIEEEDALFVITNTIVSICEASRRENPTLSFENRANYDMSTLKRAFYGISDIKHLINIEPTKWTENLKHNVIRAVDRFLDLLESMQGMDSVKRQQGQHIEYEPDWDSGMTFQSRLIMLIGRLVTYCSFNESVLIKVLKSTQERLLKKGGYKFVKKELYSYSVNCIQYDVSNSPVSVHLPLTRFGAALILELMKKRPCDKIPYDEQLVMVLDQSDRKHSMIEIMEPSLRTEVMIAQFRSNMWRRNGYSLINQITCFNGPLMRKEMYDRDILLLQECAAMSDADEFIIHLLNKFQLFNWASKETTREPLVGSKAVSFSNDEEVMAQTMLLGQEFLHLLLSIIGERYQVGVGDVTEADIIKNEIIQLLCICPLTRSDFAQKFHFADEELDLIKDVANLRRSTEASVGKYELRDEYRDRFNPFFYHYTRPHQSDALTAQLKRKKDMKESVICCPPPKPVKLTPQFSNLNQLLKCELTLTLIHKVLLRALGPPEDAVECSTKAPIRFLASDLQLDQCLHLIGLGLYEQERDHTFSYLAPAHTNGIFADLKSCYEKTSRSRDLIYWLIKKTNDLALKLDRDYPYINGIQEILEPIVRSADGNKQEGRKKNSEMARQVRERMMAQMKADQAKFMSNPSTQQLVADTDTGNRPTSTRPSRPAHYSLRSQAKKTTSLVGGLVKRIQPMRACAARDADTLMDCESDDHMDAESLDIDSEEASHLCILCRDEQRIGFNRPAMVLLAFVQRSTVLSKNRTDRKVPNYALTPSNQLKHQYLTQRQPAKNQPDHYSFTSDNSWSFDATFMPADMFFGPHVSTCGHVMHYECWKSFFDTVMRRETGRPSRTSRHVSHELEKDEILCPLCGCISNVTIPMLPDYMKFGKSQAVTIFSATKDAIEKSSENLSACLHALRGAVDTFKHIRHIRGVNNRLTTDPDKYFKLLQPKPFNEVLEELNESENLGLRDFINAIRSDTIQSNECTQILLRSLTNLAQRIHMVSLDFDRSVLDIQHARVFMMTTWSIAYTTQTYERVQRFKGAPLLEDSDTSRNLCLSSLIRFASCSVLIHQSDMMQSLLIQKLRYLLINDEHSSSSPCCLDIDVFELFTSLILLMQKLYSHVEDPNLTPMPTTPIATPQDLSKQASGSSSSDQLSTSPESVRSCVSCSTESYAWTTKNYDHEYYRNLLHLMLLLNMLQVSITLQNEFTMDSNGEDFSQDQPQTNSECASLFNFYRDIILASGHPCARLPKVDEIFASTMRQRLLPFLRSCAIFFYHLSHVTPPETLKTKSALFEGKDFVETGETFVDARPTIECCKDDSNEEFAAICSYLDLPNDFRMLLQNQEVRHLTRSWLRHSRVLLLIKSGLARQAKASSVAGSELMPVKLIRQPHTVNRLVDLPFDYTELVDKVSDFTCPSIKNEDSRTPTMCLICGVMLCSQSYCCQRDLNELASNYQLTLQRQTLARQALASTSRRNSDQQVETADRASFAGSAAVFSMLASSVAQATSYLANARRTEDSSAIPLNLNLAANSTIHQHLVGSCTYHAHECSGGVGVFLRIRTCQILLLSGRSKGCYMPAPYINEHGETDFGLLRGNPLHLNKELYEKLQQLWLTHAIPEKISRILEHSPYAASINWHLF